MVVFATLNNVRDRSAIDLEISDNVPAEVRHPDHNETATWLSHGVDYQDSREDDKNQKQSVEDPHEFVVAGLLSRPHALNPPERAVSAKLGDFAGGTFANVNGDGNDTDKRAHENHRHDPRRDVSNAQRPIKRYDIRDRRGGVQKDLRQPRDQDQDENEHVIRFIRRPIASNFEILKLGKIRSSHTSFFHSP